MTILDSGLLFWATLYEDFLTFLRLFPIAWSTRSRALTWS